MPPAPTSRSFDVAVADWALHLFFRVDPPRGLATYRSVLARVNAPILIIHDDALTLSKRTLEVRGPGLWADFTRHDATRWQVNFEGVMLALDDPNLVGRDERGERMPVEFEFEWDDGFVHGEAELGDGTRLAIDAPVPGVWREVLG